MDVIKIMPEYLDTGMEDGELEDLVEATLRAHLTQLKRAIANSVTSARSCTLMDNLEGSQKALAEARKFKNQYHHFLAELTRLRGSGPELTPEPEPNHVGVLEE
jgi:hypothetical protein